MFRKRSNTQFWYIDISNNNQLGVSKGDYSGDTSSAISAIQEFCSKNIVTIKGWHGYNTLYINDQQYDLSPGGVDIEMMLKYCGISSQDESKFQAPCAP